MAKALIFENKEKIECKSIELKGKNVLKVISVGLCGTDKHLLKGSLGNIGPFVLGHEILGIISSLEAPEQIFGDNVKVGDRVTLAAGIDCGECVNCLQKKHYCLNRFVYGFTKFGDEPRLNGGLAEFIDLEPGTSVFKIPDNMSNDTAVFIELMACLVGAVEKTLESTKISDIGKAIIVGAGPVGICAYIVAEFYGMEVYITDTDEKALEVAKKCGIKNVIPVLNEEDFNKFGAVFECAGTNSAFETSVNLASVGGVVLEFGAFSESTPLDKFPFWKVCQKELIIRGCSESGGSNFPVAIRILENTKYNIEGAITERFSLDETEKINKFLIEKSIGKGLVEL